MKGELIQKDLGLPAAVTFSDAPFAPPKSDFVFHATLEKSDKQDDDPETDDLFIEGFASTKDLDRTGDIVKPTAFASSLKDYLNVGSLFYNHFWLIPIGKVVKAEIRDKGLFVRAMISKVGDLAEQVRGWIEEGSLKAFSFAFRIKSSVELDPEKNRGLRRRIEDLTLLEVSVVTLPANARATFSVAKGLLRGSDIVDPAFDETKMSRMERLLLASPEEKKTIEDGETLLSIQSRILRGSVREAQPVQKVADPPSDPAPAEPEPGEGDGKAGRRLSAVTRNQLKGVAEELKSAAAKLAALIETGKSVGDNDPVEPDPVEPEPDPTNNEEIAGIFSDIDGKIAALTDENGDGAAAQ